MTKRLFKVFNLGGTIENDAQFAKLIYDNFGEGEYLVLSWIPKRKGMFNFMKVICTKDRFKRVERNPTQMELEKKDEIAELRRKKRIITQGLSDEEKIEAKEEIDELKEDIELTKEIIKLESGSKKGPSPYLVSKSPLYAEHEYENYSGESGEGGYDNRWI